MNKLILKTATGIATVGLLALTMAPAAFAQTITVSGNGKNSTNTVTAVSSNKNIVKQKSSTTAKTFVSSKASTGGNKANGNTGGAVAINTGAATSTVTTVVSGGANDAVAPDCGCPVDQAVIDVSGNGKNSTNTVTVVSENKDVVKQTSNTYAFTGVSSEAKTGYNTANGNTDGTVDITTGPADSTVSTEVYGFGNTVN